MEKLINLYVGRVVKSGTDYQLVSHDYGETIEIDYWNIEDKPQPTIAELEALQSQLEIQENNESILTQIAELEKSQARVTRELAINKDIDFAMGKLKSLDEQIVDLRTQIRN